MQGAIIIVLISFLGASQGVAVKEMRAITKHALEKAHTAFNAACFYEQYAFYASDVDCVNRTLSSMLGSMEENTDALAVEKFAGYVKKDQLPLLPSEYSAACKSYLEAPDTKPGSDESQALDDTKSDYPLQGFAYCIIQTLRQRHGQAAVDKAKNELLTGKVDWKVAFVTRDNMYRKRHGVNPLKLNDDLSRSAQEWADMHAASCIKLTHSASEVREYQKTYVGENLAAGGSANSMIAAYQSSNMWYSEIQYYPYPNACEETPGCPAPKKAVGHFTQTVWAATKEVGYGFAYSPKCDRYYVVGRYLPGGNIQGMERANVMGPKCTEFC